MIRWLVVLLVLPVFAFGQDTILTGKVWDRRNDMPVTNAKVRIYLGNTIGEQIAMTDEAGRFSFLHDQQIFDVDYSISIEKDMYYRLNGTVRLNFGDGHDRLFNMYRQKEADAPKVILDETDTRHTLLGAPTNNLIFLIDVSGSMAEQRRLDHLKESLQFLVKLYRPEDQISIITYASNIEIELAGGRISRIDEITRIIRGLKPTGKTEGVAGLIRAYDLAVNWYLQGGNNKVVLATDGIFGDDKKSRKLIEEVIIRGRSQDVGLSIFSFGDEAMTVSERLESWSSLGMGNHTHINTLEEAKDQIVREARGE